MGCVILCLILLVIISVLTGSYAILIVFVSALFVMLIYYFYQTSKISEDAHQQNLIRKSKEEAIKEKYEVDHQVFLSNYGTPDKSIIIKHNDINAEIHVFEDKQEICILGKFYNFSDIISCSCSDNSTTYKGKTVATTHTANASMVSRAIAGGVVAGAAGAVIGGATSKRQTEYTHNNDTVYHHYTIVINIDNISNPIIRIDVGGNANLRDEILGLINVIISRNIKDKNTKKAVVSNNIPNDNMQVIDLTDLSTGK